MLIKYVGGRSHYKLTFNRMPYFFNKENDRTLETTDQRIINYIFSLPNQEEFRVVEENKPVMVMAPDVPTDKPIEEKKSKKEKKDGKKKI